MADKVKKLRIAISQDDRKSRPLLEDVKCDTDQVEPVEAVGSQWTPKEPRVPPLAVGPHATLINEVVKKIQSTNSFDAEKCQAAIKWAQEALSEYYPVTHEPRRLQLADEDVANGGRDMTQSWFFPSYMEGSDVDTSSDEASQVENDGQEESAGNTPFVSPPYTQEKSESNFTSAPSTAVSSQKSNHVLFQQPLVPLVSGSQATSRAEDESSTDAWETQNW